MLLFDISTINRYAKQKHEAMVCNLGYSWYDSIILIALSEEPGINQNKISELLQMDKANVSKMISSLEQKGLIKRKENRYDKRYRLCFLTNEGKKEVVKLKKLILHLERDWFKNFTDEEITIYHEMNGRLIFNLKD